MVDGGAACWEVFGGVHAVQYGASFSTMQNTYLFMSYYVIALVIW